MQRSCSDNTAAHNSDSLFRSMRLAICDIGFLGCAGSLTQIAVMRSEWPNDRSGVDAGWRALFALQCPWPRATHRERYLLSPRDNRATAVSNLRGKYE